MSLIWMRTAFVLGIAIAGALVAWPIFGLEWALGVLILGLALLLLRHLFNLQVLMGWLKDPGQPVPQGGGVWEHVFTALYRMVRATNQQHHRLTGMLARFKRAGQALPDGVIVLDADDRIEWCNPIAERYYGLNIEQDAGQPVVNLVRQPDFVTFMQSGRFDEPLTMRLQRGELLVLSVSVIPYGQDQKLLLSRDITQAEKVETMRRDFVANVSHELKTPVTVVSGFLETIADGTVKLDETRGRQVLEIMLHQSGRMRRLIEDLLALSALESTTVPVSETSLDMMSLLQGLLEEARALSGGRHAIILDTAPGTLEGNEQELRSAFGNLISNAVRYTPQGGTIRLAWRERVGEGVFSVEDSGIGIEPRHVPRLTERFYRVDSGRSSETGGTGLGLAIVKHVLTRHQAALEIRSEPGQGSCFSAVFPSRRVKFKSSVAAA